MLRKRFGYRRTLAVGAVWVAALAGLVSGSTPVAGQVETDGPGTGSAFAQGFKVDPRSGRLSFGITYGLSLAGHQNLSSVAEARSADLGLIGTTLAAEGCDGGEPTLPKDRQPVPLVARTDDADPDVRSEDELGVTRSVEVAEQPFAKAVAITAGLGETGVISIGGTKSTTTSGIVDGARVARAITEIGDIDIAGLLQIKGMRWEAAYQTAPTESVLTAFTVDGIFLAGTNITGPIDNPFANLAQITDLLRPLGLGIEITPPALRQEQGIAFVDALTISIVPGEVRDSLLGSLLSAAQPLRAALTDALIAQDCGNASYITIADIVAGSVTGAGELNIELGGVTATTADINATSFLGDLPDFTPSAPVGPAPSGLGTGGSTFVPTPSPAPVGAATTPEAPAAPVATERAVETSEPETISGSRGGALLGVGLGGLLLLGLLAEGDRRKMRRGQRSGPMEVKA